MSEPGGIVAALVAFQAALPRIEKTSTAQYGKYADLADVAGTVLPRLAQHGLAYVCELLAHDDQKMMLHAKIEHTSGETRTCQWPVLYAGPQNMGSQVTYGRRYCLLALCGVHPAGEDDDAQEAQKAHEKLARDTVKTTTRATRSKGRQPDDEWTTPPPRPKGTDTRSPEQSTAIFATLGDLGLAHDQERGRALIARLAGWETPKSTKELTRAEAAAVIDALTDIHQQTDPAAAIAAILGEQEPLL